MPSDAILSLQTAVVHKTTHEKQLRVGGGGIHTIERRTGTGQKEGTSINDGKNRKWTGGRRGTGREMQTYDGYMYI